MFEDGASINKSFLERVPQCDGRLVFVVLIAKDADARGAKQEETPF